MINFRIIIAVLALTGSVAFINGCEYHKGEQGPITTPLAQDGTIIDLEKRITELRGQLDNPSADASAEQIRALQEQIADLQREIEDLKPAPVPPGGGEEQVPDEVASGAILADVPYASLPPLDLKTPEVKHDSFLRPSGNEWGTIQLRR